MLRAYALPEARAPSDVLQQPTCLRSCPRLRCAAKAPPTGHRLARAAGADRVVLRLSYAGGLLTEENKTALGLRDAARLTGTAGPWSAEAVQGIARTTLHPPAPAWPSASGPEPVQAATEGLDGLQVTGAWWCGTGLAAVTAHASQVGREAADS